MGIQLVDADEGIHDVGTASNWNESRYVDFWDSERRLGGWFRIGNRPNEGYAEMSACVYLPDGAWRSSSSGRRSRATRCAPAASRWEVVEPWRANRVGYSGEMLAARRSVELTDPKRGVRREPPRDAEVEHRSVARPGCTTRRWVTTRTTST